MDYHMEFLLRRAKLLVPRNVRVPASVADLALRPDTYEIEIP
jgi:hypothetical protein